MSFVRVVAVLVLLFYISEGQLSKLKALKQILKNYETDEASQAPTKIHASIYIETLEVQEHTFTTTFYLRTSWNDTRLRHNTNDFILVPPRYLKRIWLPDLYFRNALEVKNTDLPGPQKLIRIYNNGKVWYSAKYWARFSCPMKFNRYPSDTQKCQMNLESFAFTTDNIDMAFMPDKPSMVISERLEMPGWTVLEMGNLICTVNYSSGAYPCLGFTFTLTRDSIAQHRSAGPSLLLVVLYLSFFLGMKNPVIRFIFILFIGLTIWLAGITLQVTSLRPEVAYITSGDIFLPATGLVYFLVLLHFMVVYRLSTKGEQDDKGSGPFVGKAKIVDKIGMIGYPILLVLWFIIYYSLFQ